MKDLMFRTWGGAAVGWSKWLQAPCAWWGQLDLVARAMLEEGERVGFGKLQLAYMDAREIERENREVATERGRLACAAMA